MMVENVLERLFTHNHWANLEIIKICSALSDEQLDAEPKSAMYGSIRQTLLHLVTSQQGYLRLLTWSVEERRQTPNKVAFDQLQESAMLSGEALRGMAREWSSQSPTTQLQTMDGFRVEPWVVMVQVINHATEHREQVKSMLTALGVTPPEIDGWSYAEFTGASIPPPA
jgi:uncharacterized damage-inducible protein DinB